MKSALEVSVNSLIKSFQEHPSLTSFIVLALVGFLSYSVHVFAEKTVLNDHIQISNKQFEEIGYRLNKMDLGILTRSIESEIFELERIIGKGEAREIDHKRLSKLKYDLKQAERQYEYTSFEN